jgi:hypothetical protein
MLIQINKEVECWLPIPDYEGLYEISNLGRVKSLPRQINAFENKKKYTKKKILKNNKNIRGYDSVVLCKNTEHKQTLVHRLVCLVYKNDIDKTLSVNHINGIKDDNRIENLEYVTAKENTWHMRNVLGYRNENDYIAINQYDLKGRFIKKYKSIMEASRQTGTYSANISACAKGKLKKTNNFIWRYESCPEIK